MTSEYREACKIWQLKDGKPISCHIDNHDILICQGESGIFAVVNRCSHADAPLHDGRVRRNLIMCPLHGARFDLATGACIGGQYRPLATFETKVVGECVLVRLT